MPAGFTLRWHHSFVPYTTADCHDQVLYHWNHIVNMNQCTFINSIHNDWVFYTFLQQPTMGKLNTDYVNMDYISSARLKSF